MFVFSDSIIPFFGGSLGNIEKYKLNLINFKGLDVNDYGGGVIY